MKFDLKKADSYAILYKGLRKHKVLVTIGEIKTAFYCKLFCQHFMQASNQKTPALKRKSHVVTEYLDNFEAHPVNRLFSGAGVPLIGLFRDVASFVYGNCHVMNWQYRKGFVYA